MDTKDAILELRKRFELSQDEFANQLFVTRQAVSRWENGETTPNIDTLKLIANTFHTSVDALLGNPVKQCQSCGMELIQASDKGSELDGGKSEDYCAFCYKNGKFVHDIPMEEMVEHNLKDLDEWNASVGLKLNKEEAREMLMKFLPTLDRWKKSK